MTAAGQQLIGTWRLADWARVDADGKRTPALPGATGLINYTADGFMFATLMGPNRAPFAGGDPMGVLRDPGKNEVITIPVINERIGLVRAAQPA